VLKQLLVIPRTPNPAPLEEILVEDLNIGELRELTRHQKVQAGAISIGIKKERVRTNLRTDRVAPRKGFLGS
jgi:hypothetical protein